MRKCCCIILLVALLLTALAGCRSFRPEAAPSQTTTSHSEPTDTQSATTDLAVNQLTREEAQKIALEHAGFTLEQVKYLETELDRDDGKLHYDVDFEKDGYDYDYEIDAATGKILKSQKERD